MVKQLLGKTGIEVSVLGYGAGHIGSPDMNEDYVGYLLNEVLNLGITLFDTARGYNLSEERIGRHLSWRRNETILSTKVGYGIDGVADWTYDCIMYGVEQALYRMQTSYIDIVHLHTCNASIMQHNGVIEALERCINEGTVRVAAYSGDNADLQHALSDRRLGSVQCSINIADQRPIAEVLPVAQQNKMGVIAKRPLANAPWRFAQRPAGHYCEPYWERMQSMNIENPLNDWDELALRFVAFLPGVSSCIVGSTNLDNIKRNVAAINKGALPAATIENIRNAFLQHDNNWVAQV